MRARLPAALAPALLVIGLAAGAALAEDVRLVFLVTIPPGTPADAGVWLAGDAAVLGGWSPAGLRCTPFGDGRFTAVASVPRGTTLEFKVTRGSWETVEKGAGGEELANRRWSAVRSDTVRVTVAAWRDQTEHATPRSHTLTGDVRTHPALHSRYVRDRQALVWLPPGYDAAVGRRYPVVYLHDGQNVFDAATSFIGVEWGADETADRLVRADSIPPCILVAVANTPDRIADYTWVPDERSGGGGAAAYARYLIEELKPSIDSTYRTLPDAAHTTVLGSSLGGIVSLWLALEHPGVFGRVGCVSPATWWAGRDIVRVAAAAPHAPARVWLDIGTAEGAASEGDPARALADTRALRDALAARADARSMALHYEEVAGARHDERAWSARLDRILVFLLAEPAPR